MKKKPTTPAVVKSFKNLPRQQRIILSAVLVVVGLFALACIILAGFTISYQGKIYPKTYVGGINYGGKTITEASQAIAHTVTAFPNDITITVDGTAKTALKRDKLGAAYSADATAQTLYNVGRADGFLTSLKQVMWSLFAKNTVPYAYTLDQAAFTKHITEVADTIGTQANDSKLVLNPDNTITVSAAQTGTGVPISEIDTKTRTALAEGATTLSTESHTIAPKITPELAQDAVAYTTTLLSKAPVTVTAGDQKATADTKKVFSWITYEVKDLSTATPTPEATPTASPAGSVFIAPAQAAKAPNYRLIAKVDPAAIKEFATSFADTIKQDPINAELAAVNGQIVVTRQHVDGRKLNVDTASQTIAEKLDTAPANAALTVAISPEIIQAAVKESNIKELGIKELIGTGMTEFKGSPSNRIHNITTGATFLNGELIPPGGEFSTVKTLGAVDGSTGYLPELVIKENRTTPEYGGGLCQVSTTLFRAVMNAGLKVTERSNHSYRVSYYEPPVGLDATIYLPKPDFKFSNDTPGYILVQSKVVGTKITFDLYGTKDGRTSTISDPIVSNIKDSGPAIYTNTDTLFQGEVKQVEKAHAGATAMATYVVTRDGKEINRQVFRSVYKPWPARYLVGTKPPASGATPTPAP